MNGLNNGHSLNVDQRRLMVAHMIHATRDAQGIIGPIVRSLIPLIPDDRSIAIAKIDAMVAALEAAKAYIEALQSRD